MNKTYKNGRLALKYLDPETEKTKSLTLLGLKEDATTEEVQKIQEIFNGLLETPAQTVEVTHTYTYIA